MGRKARQFTDEEIQLVRRMLLARATVSQIAKAVGTSRRSIERHFHDVIAEVRKQPPEAPTTLTAWTTRERELVKSLSGYGMPIRDIAAHFKMSQETLRTTFGDELQEGDVVAKGEIARTLYTMAVRDRVPSAAIFLAKVRLGFRDRVVVQGTVEHQHTGQVDHAVQITAKQLVNQLDDEGRAALEIVLEKLGAPDPLAPLSPPSVH